VPEHQRRGLPEHEQFEALCALAAGGLLEGGEFVDFQAHLKECSECRSDYQELSALVTRELPQAQGTFRQKLAEMRAKPLPYSRQRFLRRARAGGVVFSPEVETPVRSGRWYFRPVTMLAPIAAGCDCGRSYGLPFPRDAGHSAGEGRRRGTADR